MKQISVIILSVFLVFVLILSGCTKTEYITITDTIVVTETTTVITSDQSRYSQVVCAAIYDYAIKRFEDRGWLPLIAGFGYGSAHIELHFYGEANTEIIEFTQSAIDEIAPGLPLEVYENVVLIEE
jgi:hypothetical protein